MKKVWVVIIFIFITFLVFGIVVTIWKLSKKDNSQQINQMIPPYYEKEAFNSPTEFKKKLEKPEEKIKVPIFLYHYVEYVKDENDTMRKKLDITPNIFEKQIQTLLNYSYTPIFIDDLADYLDSKRQLPSKPIILTFDDGYADFYTVILPLLKKYKIKATVYVVPGFLDKLNYMTQKQVQEIAKGEFVEVASHTLHHINLKSAKESLAEKEIIGSKKQLEQLIGKEVWNFAYPYGGFNKNIIKLVEKAGYRTAASVVTGSYQSVNNRYFLFRLRPGARTDKNLVTWLENLRQ